LDDDLEEVADGAAVGDLAVAELVVDASAGRGDGG
jgi:hypothetical protein